MKDLVYEIVCNKCGDRYGGETGQHSCKRFYQHTSTSSAVSEHCREHHDGEHNISMRLVCRTKRFVHRKCYEAVYNHLNSDKLSINRRIEGNGTVNLHF